MCCRKQAGGYNKIQSGFCRFQINGGAGSVEEVRPGPIEVPSPTNQLLPMLISWRPTVILPAGKRLAPGDIKIVKEIHQA
jgi:hypothetical protein